MKNVEGKTGNHFCHFLQLLFHRKQRMMLSLAPRLLSHLTRWEVLPFAWDFETQSCDDPEPLMAAAAASVSRSTLYVKNTRFIGKLCIKALTGRDTQKAAENQNE